MAMETPESRMPSPSPQPSRELLEGSWGLELTPERQGKPRERIRKSKKTAQGDTTKSSNGVPPASALSMPQLNSTAQLCNRIHLLKQHNRNPRTNLEPSPTETSTNRNRKLPTPSHLSAIKENVADLEGILNLRPLKEVNIPRHTNRYSDLVPVDVSEESFQKLTTKPMKREIPHKPGVKSRQETEDTVDEPSLMDFFSSDLQWEEAEWTVNTKSHSTSDSAPYLEPVDVPRDASLTLYTHMQHTWY